MFAFLCATAIVAADPAPVPIPERWLLKLLPSDLPTLSDRLYAVTWYNNHSSRNISMSWDLWIEFRKTDRPHRAEALITMIGGRNSPSTNPQAPIGFGHRSSPLAVHGPLLEFDRRLYTAAIRKYDGEKDILHLGSAIELKNNVWYQAGTRTEGKIVTVEEWRLEFKENPRTAAMGAVTVRNHSRILTEAEGKSFVVEARFKAVPPNERTKVRIVYLVPPDENTPRLPELDFGDDSGRQDVIWVKGQDRMSLRPTITVEQYPAPPELVQPPAKK